MALGLLPRSGIGPASLPFKRAAPAGTDLASRFQALEIDVERLIRGWDQHIPQLLETAANAKSDLHEASRLEAKMRQMEQAIEQIQARILISNPLMEETTRSAGAPTRLPSEEDAADPRSPE